MCDIIVIKVSSKKLVSMVFSEIYSLYKQLASLIWKTCILKTGFTVFPLLLVHGSFFKTFSIVLPAPWLAKVESSQKSNGIWFFRHFFAPYLFHSSRNNRHDKLHSKFWREKIFRKPHLKLLRWFSVQQSNRAGLHKLLYALYALFTFEKRI